MTAGGSLFRHVGRRILAALPALIGVVIFTFLMMRVLPGDPAVFFTSDPNAGQEQIEQMRASLGLDKPIPVQLGYYVKDLATGNLGRSMTTGNTVLADLRERLPASLELTTTALAIALLVSLPLGIIAALRQDTVVDHAVRLICSLGVCLPTFVVGLLLIYVFYVKLGIAPDPTGRLGAFDAPPPNLTGFLLVDFLLVGDFPSWRSAFSQLILPSMTMAFFVLAPLARMTRASMLIALGSDFVRTAKALGLSTWKVVVTYALRNALLPVLTMVGVVFSTMLGANVLVEKVFAWPGVGSYALDALLASDYAPVQGFVLLVAAVFILVNLLIDTLYGIADPRVSIE